MPRFTYAHVVALGLAVIVGLVALYFYNDARTLRARAATAERQAEFNGEATRQLDHYTTNTTIIREKTKEAEHVVRNLPGADEQLDPANRAALCAQLERVRGSAVCTPDGAGHVP